MVVMGHVDHGKTSLLDHIRKAHVAQKESGGITQHIGAYQVEKNGKKITFLDTPGHEAFSQMRSRGAKVADIAILVIDASETIKPQTKEAISHIKKAGIAMIVALNKIDKPEANPEKIKRELAKENIQVESMGGDVPSIEVSAKTGKGVEELLDMILLVAEMRDLKTDLSKSAEGVVIEAFLDQQKGPVATLILNQGELAVGDIIGTFSAVGKIKALEDFQNDSISKALPSQPVIVLGLENVPRVGEEFKVFPNAESAASNLKIKERKTPQILSIKPDQKVLNIILKADFLGSLEAIEDVLKDLPQEKVILRILYSGVGEITESDLTLAIKGQALVLGFRVKLNVGAQRLLDRERIRIMQFEIIYDLVEKVRQFMEKTVEPEMVRNDLGRIKTLIVFLSEKNRQIVGGKVIEGEVRKGTLIEVLRGNEIVGRGKMINLQRDKKNIEKGKKGEEVGLLYEGNVKIEEGDILIIYTQERRRVAP